MLTKDYRAADKWHGGQIHITATDGGYAIEQFFCPTWGYPGPNGDGTGLFLLGWRACRNHAITEARAHSRARGDCPVFIELAAAGL